MACLVHLVDVDVLIRLHALPKLRDLETTCAVTNRRLRSVGEGRRF